MRAPLGKSIFFINYIIFFDKNQVPERKKLGYMIKITRNLCIPRTIISYFLIKINKNC